MNSRDERLVEKIVEYCEQIQAALSMFGNDESKFVEGSVFQNA